MWEMLCKNAKDFSLIFSNIELIDEEYATCNWVANYTFSKTGNKVTNNIKAFMRLKDGKIIEHSDAFRLSTWISQALGWKGVLFGWTGFMKRAVQNNARKNLVEFYAKEKRNQQWAIDDLALVFHIEQYVFNLPILQTSPHSHHSLPVQFLPMYSLQMGHMQR